MIQWVIRTETLNQQAPFGIDIEKDGDQCYALQKKLILTGNRLTEVSNFISVHFEQKIILMEKYYSYTPDEQHEIYSRKKIEDIPAGINELSFHIENRRKSKEIGIEIPLFIKYGS